MADPSAPPAPHLQRLNPEQLHAVTTLDGPLLILAGAGSGKTRVLTRRIAHMLHQGVDPKNILAVTFTNKAAAEMKERVKELIGDRGERLWVSTFHSTCCRILREDIEALGYTRRFAIYDDDDQKRLLRDIIANHGFDTERVEPRAILSKIDHYKNHMLDVEQVIAQKRSHVNDPLIRVWRDYDEALRASDALDFNDLISMTVRLFREHPEILERWQQRFLYVMVDEYQDTNRAQYELLRLLAGTHRNLAVVGDDDQSIYGFRGADVSNILNFEEDYPEATVIRLEQNYRSSAHILALANAVVARNEGRLAKKLWTQAPGGPKVQLVCCEDEEAEASRVVDQISQLRRMGHPYSDIAIIYRTNATSRVFERALKRARIPLRIVGGRKFYERREIRDILCYLRLVINPADDAAFLRIINVPTRGIGAKTLSKLREDATTRGLPLLQTARGRVDQSRAGKSIAAFVQIIDELTEAAKELPPHELAHRAIVISGYKAMLEADVDKGGITRDARGRLENLDELIKDAHSATAAEDSGLGDPLSAWMDQITLAADTHDLPQHGEVTLMTVHSSKGLEFPVVFVVQMVEKRFPHERSGDQGIDEERRLAYVALTRAMKRLVITRARTMSSGWGDRRSRSTAQPSRFLFGIPDEAVTGDRPDGAPTEPTRRTLSDPSREKLRTLVQHRAQREPVTPQEAYTLVEIEDISQLERGVQVHHPRFGVGEIRRLRNRQVQVAFLNGLQRWLPMGAPEMQLVVE